MTTLFLVHQTGVYRHAFWGAYLTQQEAETAAIEHLKAEPDDYHKAEVVQVTVGEPGEQMICGYERTDHPTEYRPTPEGRYATKAVKHGIAKIERLTVDGPWPDDGGWPVTIVRNIVYAAAPINTEETDG